MSYVFKLARRLAQAHLVVFAFLLASCQDAAAPTPLSEGLAEQPIADNGWVPAGGVSPLLLAGANANEPAGYVRFAENDMSSLPNGLWKQGGLAGLWSWFPVGDKDLTIGAATVTGMVSAPGYMSTRFPAGFKAGVAPVNFGGWQSQTTPKSKVYLSIWMRIRGSGFENHPVGTKLGFLSYGEPLSSTRNQGSFMLEGTGTQAVKSAFSVRFNQQNIVTRNLTPNINRAKLVTAGPWHHIEAVFEVNVPGLANGKFKLWIDNTPVTDYSDVVYITPAKLNKFNYWKWNPTWGGMGGIRTRTDFIDIDHVYMSGLP